MKVICPACSATGNIDETLLSAEGRDITCPRCRHSFHVLPQRSGVEIIQQRESMVCPKCRAEQAVSDTCVSCGVVVQKYIRSVESARDLERLELNKLKSDLRRVDSWYSSLFDRRLASLMVRVLSLLVLLGIFMTCSMNGARRNKFYAENTEAMRKAAEGGPNRSKPDDNRILPQLGAFERLVGEAANQCLSQCDRYSIAWYDKSEPGMNMYRDHYLDSTMTEQLEALRAAKCTVDRDFRALGTPSQPYWPYYQKVKALYNVYNSLYNLATTPETHYYDFRGIVSKNDAELRQIINELEGLRPKQASGGAQ